MCQIKELDESNFISSLHVLPDEDVIAFHPTFLYVLLSLPLSDGDIL